MRACLALLAVMMGMALHAQTDPGPVDVYDREAVRAWYNTWWPRTQGAPMEFTGDVNAGIPGDTSQAYKDQCLLRLNIHRRWVGAQPVTLNVAESIKAQAAAVLCAANNQISHNPPTTWKFYSALAAEGCQRSNLGGMAGPASVSVFIVDGGENNRALGHRLTLLEPALIAAGIGNSPSTIPPGFLQLGTQAILTSGLTTPAASTTFSAPLLLWPKGFVPFHLLPGRWVAAIPDGLSTGLLDLSGAKVLVEQDGTPLPIKYWHLSGGRAVVFTLDGTDEGNSNFQYSTLHGERYFSPAIHIKDTKFTVTISGIRNFATSQLWNGHGIYKYDVVAFNPEVASRVPGSDAKLINISTRSPASSGAKTQIAGLVLTGTKPTMVLVRAAGPWLKQFQVAEALADPVLDIYAGDTHLVHNDDWLTNAQEVSVASQSINLSPFDPNSRDAAVVMLMEPGVPYTAHVSSKDGASGNALIEVYDLGQEPNTKLINISTRSFVGSGESVQIGGFVLRGTGTRKLLVRAGGPYLKKFSVEGVLEDPILTVFRDSQLVNENDDWHTEREAVDLAVSSVGTPSFDGNSKDAATVLWLDSNSTYTAQVRGKNGTTGVALIEVFSLKD